MSLTHGVVNYGIMDVVNIIVKHFVGFEMFANIKKKNRILFDIYIENLEERISAL
jgi:hypothetical protein